MARYTTELYKLVNGGVDIGLNDYPIFDETYRKTLNEKIINHYYFEEIGQETPFKFRHYFRTAMHEIMPFYNQLYKSALVEIDNSKSVDWQEEYTGKTELEKNVKTDNTTISTGETSAETDLTSNSNSESASNSSNNSETTGNRTENSETTGSRNENAETNTNENTKASDTPNGLLNPNDVNNNLYISQATENDGKTTNSKTAGENSSTENSTSESSTAETNAESNATVSDVMTSKTASENSSVSEIVGNQEQVETADNTNNYIRKIYGDQVNILQSEKLMKLRESFLNIDLMIIENQKLSECFMKIY